MNMNYYLISLIIICVYLVLFNKYFLMFLISIEFLGLLILWGMFLFNLNFLSWLFMYYLIFMVCESVLGLSLLCSVIMMMNNQSLLMMNLKC
uniref:NADH dehydrogenase subunit 4L n=1 Tax=Coelioxys fenestrata TaxID=621226 RepID=A0A7T5BMH5_9HYME|nr:NADH dehydrogenase subunit 4L [Coelioxys fenestrata]QQD78152.1 NADH dehydrogenase subunit 4L [Coelioxys fenestrata]